MANNVNPYLNNGYGQNVLNNFNQFQAPIPPSDNFIWAHGKTGASEYPLPRNYSAVIFDMDNEGVFYIKSTDMSGMPMKLREFHYTEVVNTVSIDEFNKLRAELDETRKLLEEATAPAVKGDK